MKNRIRISCLGGDGRCAYMAERLAVFGADVYTWGQGVAAGRGVTSVNALEEAVRGAEVVVLPMPAFDGEGGLSCPMLKEVTSPDAKSLFSMIQGDALVLGGRISHDVMKISKSYDFRLIDYAEREDFKIRNAVPTAEGAICLAMQALGCTLAGARVAILGYGCIGAALADRLYHLGALVTVAARKTRDVARIECDGCRAIHLTGEGSLRPLTAGYDVIFNTVPCHLLTQEQLLAMPKKTLLLELASAPGGWDSTLPLPCRAIYAPGIPGKYAPMTAGEIMAQTIDTILKEVDLI